MLYVCVYMGVCNGDRLTTTYVSIVTYNVVQWKTITIDKYGPLCTIHTVRRTLYTIHGT